MEITKEELIEMEEWYSSGVLAWYDKGESAEKDVPKLISYIGELESYIEMLEKTDFNTSFAPIPKKIFKLESQ